MQTHLPKASPSGGGAEFFFFFPNEAQVRRAEAELRQARYSVDAFGPDRTVREWTVIAKGNPKVSDLDRADSRMEDFAAKLQGTYDGHGSSLEGRAPDGPSQEQSQAPLAKGVGRAEAFIETVGGVDTRAYRAVVGDVLEVSTPAGLAYLQYSHSEYERVLRVLPGLYSVRPSDLDPLSRSPERFFVKEDPDHIVADGIAVPVGRFDPPSMPYPTFKSPERDPATESIVMWELDNGKSEWIRVGQLEPGEEWASPGGNFTYEGLIEKLASDYSPMTDAV